MTLQDRALRNEIYRQVVERGRVPSADEVATASGLSLRGVREGWQRLHDAHALVLDPSGERIRMANPFSGVPTPYRVRTRGREWYANCAWDAFGICAALHADGRIETTCADCAAPLAVEVRDEHPDDASLVFHCLVPAALWWDDIVFT